MRSSSGRGTKRSISIPVGMTDTRAGPFRHVRSNGGGVRRWGDGGCGTAHQRVQPGRLSDRGRQMQVHRHSCTGSRPHRQGDRYVAGVVHIDNRRRGPHALQRPPKGAEARRERRGGAWEARSNLSGRRRELLPGRPEVPPADVEKMNLPPPLDEASEDGELPGFCASNRPEVVGNGQNPLAPHRPAPHEVFVACRPESHFVAERRKARGTPRRIPVMLGLGA